VPSTIAQSLGLQDARDRPLMDHLVSQLNERQVLLILDNFEHLLAGAPVVARMLRETSALRVLVSSRSSLRISGEQECPVPPLAVPDPGTSPAPEALAGCESVRLFAERAAAVLPDFAVDEQNAPAIAQIARRLDGLPLALELAAARVKLLPPEAILAGWSTRCACSPAAAVTCRTGSRLCGRRSPGAMTCSPREPGGRSRATAASRPPPWPRSSTSPASGRPGRSPCPTPPGWPASAAIAGPPAPAGAAGCCWPATRCTSTARPAARA
jgi:hypothetical protein